MVKFNNVESLPFLLLMQLFITTSIGQYDKILVVRTDSGEIRGGVLTTLIIKRLFYSFKGIPYAKPPIGELRYKVEYVLY
jgi:hypothetical protein